VDDVRGEGQTLHMPTAPRTAVRILSLARLISLTGSTAAFTALFYTIYHRTGSAAWLSATLLLTFGVSGLIAPVAGILGDRFDRKRVMILSDLGGAVCFGAMALAHDPALLLAAGFLAAVAESPFWSASGAAVPNLVQEKDLAWANGLLAAGRNAGVMIGPAVGGALIHAFGASWLFAGNGVSFVVSAILVATVRASFSRDAGPGSLRSRPRATVAFGPASPSLRGTASFGPSCSPGSCSSSVWGWPWWPTSLWRSCSARARSVTD